MLDILRQILKLILITFFQSPVMSALNGWHPGERAVHKKLKWDKDPSISMLYMFIDGDMPSHAGKYHSSRLPFVPVVTVDGQGRPWGSILAGDDGKPGFIRNPRYTTLAVDAKVWKGEPLLETSKAFGPEGEMLVAGIGIDFSTRMRNKFAGKVSKLDRVNGTVQMEFVINETIGNCPKYINARDLVPHPNTSPKVASKNWDLSPTERLPQEIINFVHESDTVFFGTVYNADPKDARLYPSHLGMNQRGGRQGFCRVVPSDGRTIVLPDFSGNRFMTSVGNVEATPLASLTYVNFSTGDILYLTGTAQNLFGPEAHAVMPFESLITSVKTTGYTLVRDALPVRQRPNTSAQPSPYSPPVHYLAEEIPEAKLFDDSEKIPALLTSIELHSSTIATFTWETPKDLDFKPGQAVILDFSTLLGMPEYQHMAPMRPSSVNDDRIRTWTVASSPSSGRRSFSLTMREKRGGVVTGALFNIARKLERVKPEALENSRPLDLSVRVVGISGEFVLPRPAQGISDDELGLMVSQKPLASSGPKKLLWAAGGIGLTPFLSMLSEITNTSGHDVWDVKLLLSTREPEILLPLVSDALRGQNGEKGRRRVRLSVDVFSNKEIPDLEDDIVLKRHTGRMPPTFFKSGIPDFKEREVYLCGPELYEKAVSAALSGAGVDESRVHREGFEY